MSVVADSLSAIRYAKVRVIRDQTGLVTDYKTEGDFPKFGNNDNRVDQLATWVVSTFMTKLRKYPTYRHAMHTQSVLTITSNVVYGKATGNTPNGRRHGEPFAPGANPMHGRDSQRWMGREFVSSRGPHVVFRCLYCHNPDTWNMKNGMPLTVEHATEELRKFRSGLKIMSGGFTISGGEPLMQHRFVLKLFRAAQEMGIHTALDTNGYLGDRLIDDELEAINLVLLDIKSWDPERHRRLTGMDVDPVLAFARRLADRNRPIWLRFVFVPG